MDMNFLISFRELTVVIGECELIYNFHDTSRIIELSLTYFHFLFMNKKKTIRDNLEAV